MASHIAAMNEIEERFWRVLAHCLKDRRRLAGLSQQGLARRAGVSTSEIQHVEHGRRHPQSGTLRRLCAAFGISLPELYAQVERVDREWERAGR